MRLTWLFIILFIFSLFSYSRGGRLFRGNDIENKRPVTNEMNDAAI